MTTTTLPPSVETLREQLDDAAKHIGRQRLEIADLKSALRPFAGVCDVLNAKKTWGTTGPHDVGPSDMGPHVEVFTVGNENGYVTVRVDQFFAALSVLSGEAK